MKTAAVQSAVDTWGEPLQKLYRLNALCELFPEIKYGERARAAAGLTGMADMLPPDGALDHTHFNKYSVARCCLKFGIFVCSWKILSTLPITSHTQ